VATLLQDLARSTARGNQPFIAAFFGSPYAAMAVPDIPTMLLTYDFSDDAETSAAKAIVGEIGTSGKLPVALPGMFPLGHGLSRPPAASTP
jgi:beta-N-acetylhexosaminidase